MRTAWLLVAIPCAAFAQSPEPAIPTKVMKPDGDGPFPAVVILHDCSGLGPHSSGAPARWGALLVKQGYVVVIPDSFSTRGFAGGVCTESSPSRMDVAPARRIADAYDALAYARTLPYVDGKHVGVMGGSHGGSSTLATMAAKPPAEGFAAAIAFYPACRARYGDWHVDGSGTYKPNAPLLILIGEKDDWTPAPPCERMTEVSKAAGYPVSIKVYAGALHSFDSAYPVRYNPHRNNPNAPGGRGATTGGDAAAWEDAKGQVTDFFARQLR
jgi:dienelactone hydrolase